MSDFPVWLPSLVLFSDYETDTAIKVWRNQRGREERI
jgi:hypothetical protein